MDKKNKMYVNKNSRLNCEELAKHFNADLAVVDDDEMQKLVLSKTVNAGDGTEDTVNTDQIVTALKNLSLEVSILKDEMKERREVEIATAEQLQKLTKGLLSFLDDVHVVYTNYGGLPVIRI